jgi:hypothetical protein
MGQADKENRKSRQDSQDKTARVGSPGQDYVTGLQGQDIQNRQPGQDGQKRTSMIARTGQPEKASQNRTARTGLGKDTVVTEGAEI